MFRKVKAAKKKEHLKRNRQSEGSDEEEHHDGETNLKERLETTKKNQQLLTQLQYRHGVDAADLLKPVGEKSSRSKDQDQVGELPSNTTSQQEGHVWELRHTEAMEAFVRQHLKCNEQTVADNISTDESKETKAKLLSKDDLYKELAMKAFQLSGKGSTSDNVNSDDATTTATNTKEVLTAGAALAMAEVVLPINERIPLMSETAKAIQPQHRPSITLPNRSKNLAVPNRFRTYNKYESTPQSLPEHRNPDNKNQPQQQQKSADESAVDEERLGFTAARQHHPIYSRGQPPSKRGRSSDDRVFKNFVKRQREQQQNKR